MSERRGVFPAVKTKMNQSGQIDVPATQRSVNRLIQSGVSAAIMLPMLGENASLSLGGTGDSDTIRC
jgi:4-hydroxy-tetrahydrodipicolinate synthase